MLPHGNTTKSHPARNPLRSIEVMVDVRYHFTLKYSLMDRDELTRAVAAAESAVKQMPEGPLKTAAFQTILQELLQRQRGKNGGTMTPIPEPVTRKKKSPSSTGTTGRIEGLIAEGIFGQQRSLSEIRQILAERGWHYEPDDLGTPLTRLVQRKRLRRVRVAEAGKRTWRYSNY